MSPVRLLIVDDEAALLDLLKRYLERIGYEVETCALAQQALERFDAAPDRFALVIADLTLPDLNGEEMLDRMRGRCPGLRALISSGYPYQPRDRRYGFLQKPYLPKMLADAVEQALE